MSTGATVLALIAAVATATAVILGLLFKTAREEIDTYRAQVRIANDLADEATKSAQRMRQALKVYSQEVEAAKADRLAAEAVIKKAETVIDSGEGLEGLSDAWDTLIDKRRQP